MMTTEGKIRLADGGDNGDCKQIRMASKCGPMHPLGCGLNQGQGQGHTKNPADDDDDDDDDRR